MKTVTYNDIVSRVAKVCVEANRILPDETKYYYHNAVKNETRKTALGVFEKYVENAKVAEKNKIPLCQDTGTAVFFVKKGVDVKISGSSSLIADAINEGVQKGYTEGLLRKSIVNDPLFDRKNTTNNTPAIIHIEEYQNDILEIEYAPKGGGAENMSCLKMMPPSAGEKGIIDFVKESIITAGANPCPPLIVGIGIGGNFETAPYLAKKALFRSEAHSDYRYATLEQKIMLEINSTGVGAQGFGGDITAFAVRIEYAPCHIASFPVAVNLNCHVHRHAKLVF